jgi:hypothetical protein
MFKVCGTLPALLNIRRNISCASGLCSRGFVGRQPTIRGRMPRLVGPQACLARRYTPQAAVRRRLPARAVPDRDNAARSSALIPAIGRLPPALLPSAQHHLAVRVQEPSGKRDSACGRSNDKCAQGCCGVQQSSQPITAACARSSAHIGMIRAPRQDSSPPRLTDLAQQPVGSHLREESNKSGKNAVQTFGADPISR